MDFIDAVAVAFDVFDVGADEFDVADFFTVGAEEVVVGIESGVVACFAAADGDGVDEVFFFECFEGVVDGGAAQAGCGAFEGGVDFVGAGVGVVCLEVVEDLEALWCGFEVVGFEEGEVVFVHALAWILS